MTKERIPVVQDKDTLYRIENYSTLMQALALGERIKVNIGRGDIEIFMGEDLEVYAKNLSFPSLPDMLYSEELTLPIVVLGIVPELQKQKPEEFERFENRWEEIKTIVNDTIGHNKFSDNQVFWRT